MLTLYWIQTIVPVVLIAWIARAPPRNVAGFWVQALATGAGLLALGMTGIWAFPPWWTIYAFAALLLGSVVFSLGKRGQTRMWPKAVLGWLSLAAFAVFGACAANEVRIAFAGAQMPAGPSVALSSPLEPGVYLVANGGTAPSVNAHATFLDQTIAQHRPYRATAHGVDLIALNGWGLRANGVMPVDPQRYVIFGRAVVAPCAGEVMAAVDGLPDMPVPQVDRAHLAGNHVILRCAEVDILLGHFRSGSVSVQVGQSLTIGQAIAQVGNSGNTSEPHLHINAMLPGTAAAPFSGAPITITIDGRYLVRNERFDVETSGERP